MACTPTHCTANSTGTTTCSNHRAACATNRPLSLSGNFVQNGIITAADMENLRSNIIAEVARYKLHSAFSGVANNDPGTISSGRYIYASDLNTLDANVQNTNNVNEPVGSSYAVYTDPADNTGGYYTVGTGGIVYFADFNSLRNKYETMRQDCICNSDCTCNAVCNCHGDCGCNYSDERLKENITYLYTKSGVKWYKYNYIWDKVERIGVMAQDLLKNEFAHLVHKDDRGFYYVDYKGLPA